jgi:hypothetical protein
MRIVPLRERTKEHLRLLLEERFTMALGAEQRWEIISGYSLVLEKCSSSVEKESDLPFPKNLIRKAIYEELTENPDGELRSHLEIAFVQLESFLPPEEYKVVQDFELASRLAQEMAKSGNPRDIIASARILSQVPGDRAVRIQEIISREMQKRLEEIRSTGLPSLSMSVCCYSLE